MKLQNDKQHHVKLNSVVGKEATTPSFELPSGPFELVMEDVVGVGVKRRFGPRFLHHVHEAGHAYPKVLKAEGIGLFRTPTTSKKQ